jgi:hypothetical protein
MPGLRTGMDQSRPTFAEDAGYQPGQQLAEGEGNVHSSSSSSPLSALSHLHLAGEHRG